MSQKTDIYEQIKLKIQKDKSCCEIENIEFCKHKESVKFFLDSVKEVCKEHGKYFEKIELVPEISRIGVKKEYSINTLETAKYEPAEFKEEKFSPIDKLKNISVEEFKKRLKWPYLQHKIKDVCVDGNTLLADCIIKERRIQPIFCFCDQLTAAGTGGIVVFIKDVILTLIALAFSIVVQFVDSSHGNVFMWVITGINVLFSIILILVVVFENVYEEKCTLKKYIISAKRMKKEII